MVGPGEWEGTTAESAAYRHTGSGRKESRGVQGQARAGFTGTADRSGSTTFTTGQSATTARTYYYARSGTGYGYCDDIRVVPT
ncbi:hypothetical protein ACWGHM_29330 [Streptomyces sp. NPDC054904]